jgi:hypothetical protein
MTAPMLLIILAIFMAAWLCADARLPKQGQPTVTQLIISATKSYPMIAWMIGFLMGLLTGHLYG